MNARDAILDPEFTRVTPGLRPFSIGVLSLCRQLGLAIAVGGEAKDAEQETLTLVWLLDERHSLETIQQAPENPESLKARVMDYKFSVEPAFFMLAQREVVRAMKAIHAARVEIEPKPGDADSGGAAPRGKS